MAHLRHCLYPWMCHFCCLAPLWKTPILYHWYRPNWSLETLLVPIHMLLQDFWLNSSPVANDGLSWVKWEQATAKQWWTLQQPPNCEFRTWTMINIDQLHHLKISWYSHLCFFSHFDLIPHQWQMMASWSNRNTKQQNSGGHGSNHQIVNSGHGLWSI
jgi:hypothetical protein